MSEPKLITCPPHAGVFHGDCPACCAALDAYRPTNPMMGLIGAKATEDEARAFWTTIKDNWAYTIYEVRIGTVGLKMAEKPVCWLVLKDLSESQ